MAQYVLRPEMILPQTSLTDAIYWIAFEAFPKTFYDIEHPYIRYKSIEIGGKHGIETLLSTSIINQDVIKRFNLPENPFAQMSMGQPVFTSEASEKISKILTDATHIFFEAFKTKKIRLFGAEQKDNRIFYTESEEYIKILPGKIKYEDFDWGLMTVTKENKHIIFDSLLISTDELFKICPLKLLQSQEVKLAANNYFIDDTDNKEIIIKQGRKSTLQPSEISLVAVHCKKLMDEKPNQQQKFYIHACISWAKDTFGVLLPYQTIRGWLIDILTKQKNEN